MRSHRGGPLQGGAYNLSMTGITIRAAKLVPTRESLLQALGENVRLQVSKQPGSATSIGSVVAAAAEDSAYRSYSGTLRVEDADKPIAVGALALVFADAATSERTFSQVAAAAHLRTKLGECSVAVETVTAPNGLVIYW